MRGEDYIAIIDDEPAITRLLEILIARSFEIPTKSFTDSTAALRMLLGDADAIRLVICDLRMPELDGLQLCRSLRRAGCRFPIVLLTAYASEAMEVEARTMGVNEIVQKPFHPPSFIERLRSLLAPSTDLPPAAP